jgi:hypothetical protein
MLEANRGIWQVFHQNKNKKKIYFRNLMTRKPKKIIIIKLAYWLNLSKEKHYIILYKVRKKKLNKNLI